MNFGEMQSGVRTRLDESTAVFWSDQDIKDALNEGLFELSDATEWYERMATIPLWSTRSYLDLRCILPDTFLGPKRMINNQTGKWLVPSSVKTQDHRAAQWEKTSAEPEEFFTRGLWWMGFYPKPPNDLGSARMYFSALPPLMDDDTDEPELPEEYHMGIICYAVYDLLAQDAETEKALMWWAEYVQYETKLRDYVETRITRDKVGRLG
jgi:hypothetical protein